MKTKKMGKCGFMVMKLDMSKVYDQVEWNFMIKLMNDGVLRKMDKLDFEVY